MEPFHTDHLIRVSNLTIGYKDRVILKDVSFQVTHGEIVTILGESGCGKTTLLKALIGLLQPLDGSISILGERIDGSRETPSIDRVRRRIGVLFQSGAMLGSLTVFENVALPLKEFTDLPDLLIKEIVTFKLDLVGLSEHAHLYPAELSGGMRKRAALARAMVMDPDLLFCDEPSAGLDPVTAAGLDELLLEFNRSLQITMVVITHELTSIKRISTRAIMLDSKAQGIIAQGHPKELEEGSSDPRVRSFFLRGPTQGSDDSTNSPESSGGIGVT